MTPAEIRDTIKALEQLEEFDDWILEKDAGKYSCEIWDNKCHRHCISGQSKRELAITLACKIASEGK